ncbi:hypothetical protein CRG98_032806 [Punica granatum]|uniref:Uncharacterized protein n=1 Tax=Punica granatum TaxID=22663 RepID=A0A2I0IS44_PUNGR|nr:hypothetical protein CRG98_032806 [Punica granatum]
MDPNWSVGSQPHHQGLGETSWTRHRSEAVSSNQKKRTPPRIREKSSKLSASSKRKWPRDPMDRLGSRVQGYYTYALGHERGGSEAWWLPVTGRSLVKAGSSAQVAGSRVYLNRKKDSREKERPEKRRSTGRGCARWRGFWTLTSLSRGSERAKGGPSKDVCMIRLNCGGRKFAENGKAIERPLQSKASAGC